MMDSNFIVAPVEEWTWMAIKETRSRLIKAGLEHEWLSDDFFKVAVLNIIEDALCQKLNWTNVSGRLERYLDSQSWFQTNNEFCDIVYHSIDTIVVSRIYDLIDTYLPEKSWYSWNLRRLNSKNFYIIEKGEDYRILEYYRLKASYEPDLNTDSMYVANYVSNEDDFIPDLDHELNRIKVERKKMMILYDEIN